MWDIKEIEDTIKRTHPIKLLLFNVIFIMRLFSLFRRLKEISDSGCFVEGEIRNINPVGRN